MSPSLRLLTWILLAVLAALISYAGFRGYLNPDLLINFSNSFYC